MPSKNTPNTRAFKAGGTINANSFVKLITTGTEDDVVVACGAGDRPFGVCEDGGASGDFVEVEMLGGGAELKISATVTRGQYLKADSDGYGTPATADGDKCGAMAMQSGVANDVIAVHVHPLLAGAAE